MKLSTHALVLAYLTVSLSPLWADAPAISKLTPPGVQRGAETQLVISGSRLGDVRELLFYDAGIEVLDLTAKDENSVTATLRVPPDFQPGLHALRLSTATGLSNIRYMGVTPLPQSDEHEPNSDAAEPQKIEINSTINGILQAEDIDYYAVDIKRGQVLTVELEGIRLSTEFFDPFVAIHDIDRNELVSSDDAPLVQQDCVCSLKAPKSGRYIIEVRESSYGGNDRCQYRMHVGDFPRPLAIVPAGGRPGEVIDATVVDASGETWQQKIELPATPGDFDYVIERDGRSAPSPNRLRVVDLPNVLETELDSDPNTLEAASLPVALNGVLQAEGDVDWFKVSGKKNEQLDFTVYGRRVLRSPIDSWLEIHDANGKRLASNDDAGGPDSALSFKFPADGEYLVSIRDQLGEGTPQFAYRIEVAPAVSSVEMTIDELTRYISQTVEVPRGGQMAVLLRTNRKGFKGDLALRLENPPAGVRLVTPVVAAEQSYIPLMIEAAADAPVDAALVPLTAESKTAEVALAGKLNQRTMLVRGQNNRDMWGHNSDRLALAVTEELPFSIEVEQLKVPLVRNGSANFVVRAHRKDGYKERIYLRPLYSPSGCSASSSVRIEADQSEVLVPITANSRAELGNFPIAILARAKATNADAWVSAEFVNLEVADSFFDFKFGKAVGEPGGVTELLVGVDIKTPPEGKVVFELVGLPRGVTSPSSKIELAPEMTQLAFPLEIANDARVGQFKTLVITATIERPEGTIVQTQGTGEIQIAAAVAGASVASAASPASTSKPLSRLEQLRQAKQLLEGSQP